jgi:hypothetical protein
MKANIVFESTEAHDYVGVLDNTSVLKGLIASQDAGSTNSGIYYQIGGRGVNGFFASALGPSLTKTVNAALTAAYEARFGADSWKTDQRSSTPPRTSFYIPLPADASQKGNVVGQRVAGIVYSVGPVLSGTKIPDPGQYLQIYLDALNAVAEENKSAAAKATNGKAERIEGLRMTMVSTGIYAPPDADDAAAVRAEAAGLILDAIATAAAGPDALHLPTTFLINCGSPTSDEIDAFSNAAKALNITATEEGFTLDVPSTSVRRTK